MSDICFKDGHLTSNAFLMLDTDMLDNSQKILMLSHLNSCDECMNRFLEGLDDASLVTLVNPLEAVIIEKIELQKQEMANKKSKIRQIQYVKLAITACMTMVVFFGSSQFGQLFMHNSTMGNEIEKAPIKLEQNKNQEKGFLDKAISDFHKGFFDFSDILNNSFKKGDKKHGK